MAAKAHAILSASSSDRWLHCPPSARLCETYEDKGSDYAAEGTDAHALGEYKLKTALGIQRRLLKLQKELIKKANNKQDYDAIADEIFRLRDQKEQSEVDSHHWEETMNRIKELQDFIAGQETDITEFDKALAIKLIEKITVFTDHFTVEFKSGITIDIEA